SAPIVVFVAQGIEGRSAAYATVKAAAENVESISVPGTKAFPESITSTTDGTLWACSNDLSALGAPAKGSDTGSALKAFDLRTGNGKRSVSLPGTHAFCNDIAQDAKGSIYVTDSANPTILKLSPG